MEGKAKLEIGGVVVILIIGAVILASLGGTDIRSLYDRMLSTSEARYKTEIARQQQTIAALEVRVKAAEERVESLLKKDAVLKRKTAAIKRPVAVEETKARLAKQGIIVSEGQQDYSKLICVTPDSAADIFMKLEKGEIDGERVAILDRVSTEQQTIITDLKDQNAAREKKYELAESERQAEVEILQDKVAAVEKEATKDKIFWGAGGVGIGVIIAAALLLL